MRHGIDDALRRLVARGAQADGAGDRRGFARLRGVETNEVGAVEGIYVEPDAPGRLRKNHRARRAAEAGPNHLPGREVVGEERHALLARARLRFRAAVEDEALRVGQAGRDAMAGHGAFRDDFSLRRDGVDADEPVAFVILVAIRRARAAAMRAAVDPAIACEGELRVNLPRRVAPGGQAEQFLHVEKQAELLRRRVELVDERGATGREMVADGGVVFAVGEEAVAPVGPWITAMVLAGEIGEVHGRRRLRDVDAGQQRGGWLQEIRRGVGDEFLPAGKRGRVGNFRLGLGFWLGGLGRGGLRSLGWGGEWDAEKQG